MKRKKLLIFPLVILFALGGCNNSTSNVPAPEGNKLPEGGIEITDANKKHAQLAMLYKGTTDALTDYDHFGFTMENANATLILNSDNLTYAIGVRSFDLSAGVDYLFTGNKKSTKVGVKLGNCLLETTVKSDLPGYEQEYTSNAINIGETSLYLDNGDLYVDASKTNVPKVIYELANFIYPWIDSKSDPLSGWIISSLMESPEAVEEVLSLFFQPEEGKTFDYKMKLENVVSNFPLVDTSKTKTEGEVEDLEAQFLEQTGADINNFLTVREYDDFIGASLGLPLRALPEYAPEKTRDMGFVFDEAAYVMIVLTGTKDGRIENIGFTISFAIDVVEERVAEYLGSPYIILNTSGVLKMQYDKNPVSAPSNYDGYSTFGLAGLF